MNIMESLFSTIPEIFDILEELKSYTGQLVIPVSPGVQEYVSFQSKDFTFPMITLTNMAINLITDTLPSLSHSFLIRMMEKHRLQLNH